MKISELLLCGTEILKKNNIESAVLDSRLLLTAFLRTDSLFVLNNRSCDLESYDGYYDLIARRAAHEPMAYILGEREFMSLPFTVNRNVLIPRPDTETMVEDAIKAIGGKSKKILDIGTGSGCIAVSCLKYCRHTKAVAADISRSALEVAAANAKRNGVERRFFPLQCDILSEVPQGKYDCILSNPPYIETAVIPTLEPDVARFEPLNALCGGDDGLIFYRRISAIAKNLLNDKYYIALEVGHTQSDAVCSILKKDGYENIAVVKDLSGISRVVTCRSSKF